MSANDEDIAHSLMDRMTYVISEASSAVQLPPNEHEMFCKQIHILAEICAVILQVIDDFHLPKVCKFQTDYFLNYSI